MGPHLSLSLLKWCPDKPLEILSFDHVVFWVQVRGLLPLPVASKTYSLQPPK